MRRSVRDAIVGFTLIGGIVGFASTALWLRGVRVDFRRLDVLIDIKRNTGTQKHEQSIIAQRQNQNSSP